MGEDTCQVLTLRELLLVVPGGPVYAPPSADVELLREARRLAERDLALGQDPRDWPAEERDRWFDDHARWGEFLQVYWAVREPERLRAPAGWPEALVGMLAGTLIAARVATLSEARAMSWQLGPDLAVSAFEHGARRRAARIRGVTPETAPRTRAAGAAVMILVAVGLLASGRLGPRNWEYWLAGQIVRELDERRSWRRAFR